MTAGHKHAELMAQYAEDAKTHEHPWLLWEVRSDHDRWYTCDTHPTWHPNRHFRRKPQHLEYTVKRPEPVREALKEGQGFFAVDPGCKDLYSCDTWFEAPYWQRLLSRGLVYLTREDAIAAAKAMIGEGE